MAGPAPLLIALPDGLSVSGVTTWALRLVNELAPAGRHCALIVHDERPGVARLDAPIHPAVRVHRAPALAPDGDIRPVVNAYRDGVARMAANHAGPVVLSPNLRGDCYAAAAALVASGDPVRLVGWQHSDIEYDRRVLAHFAPAIERFVGVSGRIVEALRPVLAERADDVVAIPYGVPTPAKPSPRAPVAGRPLRLIYTGRMEHRQKRILSLVHLADELARRGIDHEITLLGDGPAADELDALIAGRSGIRRLDPVGPTRVAELLRHADAFVLGSRYEGLSVSMLEAMACACVPVVARVASGATEAIEDGINGVLAGASPDDDEKAVGAALADGVSRMLSLGPASMGRAAWRAVAERFSLSAHAARVGEFLDEVGGAAGRRWPGERPLAFDGGRGSVPPEGPALLAALLESLAGRRIVVHGTGAHTRHLWPVFERAPIAVVALSDDDRAVHATTHHGLPVIAPERASTTGATDVVISSWMHERGIWSRRAVYESQGLRVHRIYAPPGADAPGAREEPSSASAGV